MIEKYSHNFISSRTKALENDFSPFFNGNIDKTKDFVLTLKRLAWEKNSAHPNFIESFRIIYKMKKYQLHQGHVMPFYLLDEKSSCEIVFNQSKFPLTKDQINSTCFTLVLSNSYKVKTYF